MANEEHVGRGKTLGTSQIILYTVIVGLACLLVLEIVVRMTTSARPWLNARYVALSRQYAELDALIADAGWGPGEPPKYYDEFLYAASPVVTRHVTFTEYYSARSTPDSMPLSEAEHIVWTFGGSTMENTETTDSLTIANTWARVFNHTLGASHVKNFGTGGFFSSYELIKFQKLLREVPEQERPTMGIFYDGYNDAVFGFQYGPGSTQKDLSLKLQSLVESQHVRLWTYVSSKLIARWSSLWERTGDRLIQHVLFPLGNPLPNADYLARSVRVYVSNVKMLRAICDAFKIRCFFVLQPLLLTKMPLTLMEQEALQALEAHPRFGPTGARFVRTFYAEVTELLGGDEGFIDASRILNGRSDPDFYDVGHVGALTPPVIGEKIAAQILVRLNKLAPTQ
jgi:hypothetical protein